MPTELLPQRFSVGAPIIVLVIQPITALVHPFGAYPGFSQPQSASLAIRPSVIPGVLGSYLYYRPFPLSA